MSKAFRCDRCKAFYEGDIGGSIEFRRRDNLGASCDYEREYCSHCFKEIERAATHTPEEGEKR